jgi:hypothetical protein
MHIELTIHWAWLTLFGVLFMLSAVTGIWSLRLSIRLAKRNLAEVGDTVATNSGPGQILGRPSFPFNEKPKTDA